MSTKTLELGKDVIADRVDPESARLAFSEACQMFRHFVNVRYYTFTISAAVTAGLATIYFQLLPGTHGVQPASSYYWIKGCGVVVAFASWSFDWRLTDLTLYYQDRMRRFGDLIGVGRFDSFPSGGFWRVVLRLLSVLIYGVAAIAWWFFAKVPMN